MKVCVECGEPLEDWQIKKGFKLCLNCYYRKADFLKPQIREKRKEKFLNKVLVKKDWFGKEGCCLVCPNVEPDCMCSKCKCFTCIYRNEDGYCEIGKFKRMIKESVKSIL